MQNNKYKLDPAMLEEFERSSAEYEELNSLLGPDDDNDNSLSEAQLAANRRNAQLSTGPKTQAGKNRSRLNTIAHGFTCQGVVLAEEDVSHYKAHLRDFKNEYNPQGPTEAFFVESLAEISWTVAKIRAQEQTFLTIVGQTGTNPMESPDPEVNVLLAQANYGRPNAKHIELLSRYEQRKMRVFRESLRELKQLQLDRKLPVPAPQPPRPQPATNPSTENGFVCPDPKIMRAQTVEIHPPAPPTAL